MADDSLTLDPFLWKEKAPRKWEQNVPLRRKFWNNQFQYYKHLKLSTENQNKVPGMLLDPTDLPKQKFQQQFSNYDMDQNLLGSLAKTQIPGHESQSDSVEVCCGIQGSAFLTSFLVNSICSLAGQNMLKGNRAKHPGHCSSMTRLGWCLPNVQMYPPHEYSSGSFIFCFLEGHFQNSIFYLSINQPDSHLCVVKLLFAL